VNRALLAVFILALAVRLLFLFVALPAAPRLAPGFRSVPGMRFDGYHDIALELAAGRGFALPDDGGATAARAPLYPLFLATLYRAAGPRTDVVLVAHAVLGALTCVVVLLLGWELYGPAVGMLASLIFTFHPTHLWWSQYVLSESLLTLLVSLAALGLARFGRRRSRSSALAAGVLVGLAALCNSVSLMFPLALVAAAPLLLGGALGAAWRRALLVACATAVVVLPWTARNALRFHELIPVNWGIGFQAYKGWVSADHLRAHPHDDLGVVDGEADVLAIAALRDHGFVAMSANEKLLQIRRTMTLRREEDALLARLASERLRRDPAGAALKLLRNLRLYWTFSVRRMEAVVGLNLGLLVLALIGIAATARRDPGRWLPVAYAAYLNLAYASIIAASRFSLQILPIVAVFAAAGAAWAWQKLARRGRGTSEP